MISFISITILVVQNFSSDKAISKEIFAWLNYKHNSCHSFKINYLKKMLFSFLLICKIIRQIYLSTARWRIRIQGECRYPLFPRMSLLTEEVITEPGQGCKADEISGVIFQSSYKGYINPLAYCIFKNASWNVKLSDKLPHDRGGAEFRLKCQIFTQLFSRGRLSLWKNRRLWKFDRTIG